MVVGREIILVEELPGKNMVGEAIELVVTEETIADVMAVKDAELGDKGRKVTFAEEGTGKVATVGVLEFIIEVTAEVLDEDIIEVAVVKEHEELAAVVVSGFRPIMERGKELT